MEKEDIKKTTILTISVIIAILFFWSLFNGLSINIDKSNKEQITEEEIIDELMAKINSNLVLRKANISANTLDNETILKYILLNLKEDDMKLKKVKPVKITCTINKKVLFTTDKKTCNVLVISNDTFYQKEKEYFNLDKELDLHDFNYYGYNCKNDTKNYYCMKQDYTEYTKGFSYIDSKYKENDEIIVNEYFLMINVSDIE